MPLVTLSRPLKMNKPFDLLVYGATGFTGRLVVEYLLQKYGAAGTRLRWGMVGRSADKLAQVRDALGAPAATPLVIADAADPVALAAMVRMTKVVITTVGPYQLYGEPLVAACAEAGTDYVDLCGEPAWMRLMMDAHHAAAQKSGARIVFSCGFDSIPFDLGVWFLQQEFKGRFGQTAPRVKGRVRKMKGTFSGGTAASMRATMAAAASNPHILELLKNPFALTPGFEGPKQPHGMKPMLDESISSWVAPFVMAPINTRNVHRTNALLGHAYGADFVYDEMMITGPGEKGEAMAMAIAGDRSMSSGAGPKPGEGPSKEEREAGFYDLMFLGELFLGELGGAGETKRMSVTVKGDKDPGYGSTSKMITEAALCLLLERIGTEGGMWTPGALMAEVLVKRLRENAGLSFTVDV
jgi:short subunit dehydrogenase-like uncharacterized protein